MFDQLYITEDNIVGSLYGGICLDGTCVCTAACLDARLEIAYNYVEVTSTGTHYSTPVRHLDFAGLSLSAVGTRSKNSGGSFANCRTSIELKSTQGGGTSWGYTIAAVRGAEIGTGEQYRTRTIGFDEGDSGSFTPGTATETYTVKLQTDYNATTSKTKISARFYHAVLGGSTTYESWFSHSGISTAGNNTLSSRAYSNTYNLSMSGSQIVAPNMWYLTGIEFKVERL